MYVFYLTHQRLKQVNPLHTHPVVKEMKTVVKRISPLSPRAVPLDENRYRYAKEFRQTRLTIEGFSFFKDVVCRIVPSLQNVN
jgi:hypothetical protein